MSFWSNMIIQFERQKLSVDLSRWVQPEDEVIISAITVSGLLMGVHRADSEIRR
jgi:hypothetical protein